VSNLLPEPGISRLLSLASRRAPRQSEHPGITLLVCVLGQIPTAFAHHFWIAYMKGAGK